MSEPNSRDIEGNMDAAKNRYISLESNIAAPFCHKKENTALCSDWLQSSNQQSKLEGMDLAKPLLKGGRISCCKLTHAAGTPDKEVFSMTTIFTSTLCKELMWTEMSKRVQVSIIPEIPSPKGPTTDLEIFH